MSLCGGVLGGCWHWDPLAMGRSRGVTAATLRWKTCVPEVSGAIGMSVTHPHAGDRAAPSHLWGQGQCDPQPR